MKGGSGARRHLITYQVKTEVKSSSGATTEVWTDSFDEYAAFEPVGTREFRIDQKRHAEATGRWRHLYRSGINPDFNRIAHVVDPDVSPPLQNIWNILGVMMADGKFAEMLVEVNETK